MARQASTWMRGFHIGTKRPRRDHLIRPVALPVDVLEEPVHPWTAQKDFFPPDTVGQFRALERALRSEEGEAYV